MPIKGRPAGTGGASDGGRPPQPSWATGAEPCRSEVEPYGPVQGPCGRPDEVLADLDALGPVERAQALAALTARFAASYVRAMGSRGNVLSYPRVRALEVLASGPAIMKDLADALGTTPRNVTAMVDALEHGGLVTRLPHPSDRRATVIELTDLGRTEARQAGLVALERVTALFSGLGLAEQKQYAQTLGQLLTALCHPTVA